MLCIKSSYECNTTIKVEIINIYIYLSKYIKVV